MNARQIAIGETDAVDGRFLFQVLSDDGTPCTTLTLGDLWVARNGDASYSAATGSLTAITVSSENVGTYRYVPSASEKSVLGQGLLMVKKAGVLYTPTEFLIAATKGAVGEPTIGPVDLVKVGAGTTNNTTQVNLSANAHANLNEYDGAEFRVLAGANRGVVRAVIKAETISGNVVLTLDRAMPLACDGTSRYAVINRWVRGMTAEQMSSLFREWRDGHPPAAGIPFNMKTTLGLDATGATVTIQVRKNNGVYSNAVNATATELSNGEYKWVPDASEWTAGLLTFRASAGGCVPYTAWFVILPASIV